MKKLVTWLSSMFPFWVMVLKLSKKLQFLQFCDDLNKISESVTAIYIYASESSHYTISENDIVIGVWTTAHEILAIKISKKMLTRQKFR